MKTMFHSRAKALALLLLLCASGSSCSGGFGFAKSSRSDIKIMNWNVQTFFDSVTDGTEYDEFKQKSANWNEAKYNARLERLVQVIRALDADVVVMQELENSGQLYDISNRLQSTFNFSSRYHYGAFIKEDGASIGIGVISRLQISDVKSHSLDIRSERSRQPSLRPILQFTVTCGGKELIIFANHWKSKSGGKESSDVWRAYQESSLARLFHSAEQAGLPAVACGDFNADISDFCFSENANSESPDESEKEDLPNRVILRGKQKSEVYSTWILSDGSCAGDGTYYYKGEWEKIDHFFSSDNGLLFDFRVESQGNHATEDGRPMRYYLPNGSGYSDHFPITCRVSLP